MASLVLTNATIWVGAYDLQSNVNSVEEEWSYEEVDATTFGSAGNKERKAGLASTVLDLKGFADSAVGASEPVLHAINGTANSLATLTPTGAAHDSAFILRGLESSLKRGFKVGDMALISGKLSSSASEGLVHGQLLIPKTTATASANGTIYQDGAVSSTQTLYAALHVFAASGTTPTLAVKVQSAAAAGFGTPNDQITFTTATGVTSEFKSLAGANTNTYWRVSYTIAGTTPSFSFAVAFGIQ